MENSEAEILDCEWCGDEFKSTSPLARELRVKWSGARRSSYLTVCGTPECMKKIRTAVKNDIRRAHIVGIEKLRIY